MPKLKSKDLYLIALLFLITPPGIVEYIPYRDTVISILNGGKVIFALLSIWYVAKRTNLDWIMIYLWCFYIGLMTYYNFGRYTYLFGYVSCIIDGLFAGYFFFNTQERIKIIYNYFFVLTCLYFLSIIVFPEGIYSVSDARFYRAKEVWVYGLYSQASPAIIISIALLAAKREIEKNNFFDLCMLGSIIGSSLLINCGTLKTGIIFFVGFYFFMKKRETFHYQLFVLVICATFLILTTIGLEYFSFYVENILNKDITATGRVFIWNLAIDTIRKSPFLGHGIQSSEWMYETIEASHCHDFYLNLLLEGGLIHLMFFVFITTKALKSFNSSENKKVMLGILCGIIAMLVCFLSEAYSYRFCCPFYIMLGILMNYHNNASPQTAATTEEPEPSLQP